MSTPQDFDHRHLDKHAEYQAVAQAVNALAGALRRTTTEVSQDDFEEVVLNLARTLYAADNCECGPGCRRLGAGQAVWPYRADTENGGMLCHYRCPRTGREWTCSWSTDPTMLDLMPR